MRQMTADGALRKETVRGRPCIMLPGRQARSEPSSVRLLAPFDPVVWDRRRFKHLWGRTYRFEAKTPLAKRVWEYYALPLLGRSTGIGRANVRSNAKDIELELGFIAQKPHSRDSDRELAAEVERFRTFMRLG